MRDEFLDKRQEGLLRSVEEDVLSLLFANAHNSVTATSATTSSSNVRNTVGKNSIQSDVNIWSRVYVFLLRASTLAYNILLLSVLNTPIVLPAAILMPSEGAASRQGHGDDAAVQLELMVKALRELLRQSALEFSLCVALCILASCIFVMLFVAVLLIMVCTSKKRALPQAQQLNNPYRR